MSDFMKVAPSILASDFGNLRSEAQKVEKAGADLLHLDVMDGHFVPNLTFGPMMVESIKKDVSIPFDVHLMISRPDIYADAFIKAGANYITSHAEADHDIKKTILAIKDKGVKAGPAINPDKGIELIKDVLPISDIVLVMSVFPGFGGQKFIDAVLTKVEELKKIREENGFSYEIEIDGGINLETVVKAKKAGVDIAVAGTAVFGSADMFKTIEQMKCKDIL